MRLKLRFIYLVSCFFFSTVMVHKAITSEPPFKKSLSKIDVKDQNNSMDSRMSEVRVELSLPLKNFRNLPTTSLYSGDIMREDFEGDFPTEKWRLSGNPTWGKDDYKPHCGKFSLWCARSGTSGKDPQHNNYPNHCESYLFYGPFCLKADGKNIRSANLNFYYWLKTEQNYDWFSYLISKDGIRFKGWKISGTSSGWGHKSIDLLEFLDSEEFGQNDSLWVAFTFTSDGSITEKGVFLDDIRLIPIGESNWQQFESPVMALLNSVNFVNDTTGWTVGYSALKFEGVIIKTTDGGKNWVEQKSGTSCELASVKFVDEKNGWAVGSLGTILKTENGGDNWQQLSSGINKKLYSVYFLDRNRGWAMGSSGTILKTIDGGRNWIKQESGTTKSIWDIHFINADTGWAVGRFGLFLKTTDGGKTWENIKNVTSKSVRSVYFTDMNIGWVVGDDGIVLKTVDGGKTWIEQISGTAVWLRSVYFINNKVGWVVGDNGIILKTKNAGDTWLTQQSGTANSLMSVQFIDPQNGWAVGGAGTILRTTSGGEEPKSENLPPQIISPDTAYAYEDSLFKYIAKAVDPEMDKIGYDFQNYPTWLMPIDSVISGITPQGAPDTSFMVIACDGELADTLKVFIRVKIKGIEKLILANNNKNEHIPEDYFLQQNYPNPFNPTTTISFGLPERKEILINVYNLKAELVSILFRGIKDAGFHKVIWKATNHPSGIYFIRLNAGNYVHTVKSILLK